MYIILIRLNQCQLSTLFDQSHEKRKKKNNITTYIVLLTFSRFL